MADDRIGDRCWMKRGTEWTRARLRQWVVGQTDSPEAIVELIDDGDVIQWPIKFLNFNDEKPD